MNISISHFMKLAAKQATPPGVQAMMNAAKASNPVEGGSNFTPIAPQEEGGMEGDPNAERLGDLESDNDDKAKQILELQQKLHMEQVDRYKAETTAQLMQDKEKQLGEIKAERDKLDQQKTLHQADTVKYEAELAKARAQHEIETAQQDADAKISIANQEADAMSRLADQSAKSYIKTTEDSKKAIDKYRQDHSPAISPALQSQMNSAIQSMQSVSKAIPQPGMMPITKTATLYIEKVAAPVNDKAPIKQDSISTPSSAPTPQSRAIPQPGAQPKNSLWSNRQKSFENRKQLDADVADLRSRAPQDNTLKGWSNALARANNDIDIVRGDYNKEYNQRDLANATRSANNLHTMGNVHKDFLKHYKGTEEFNNQVADDAAYKRDLSLGSLWKEESQFDQDSTTYRRGLEERNPDNWSNKKWYNPKKHLSVLGNVAKSLTVDPVHSVYRGLAASNWVAADKAQRGLGTSYGGWGDATGNSSAVAAHEKALEEMDIAQTGWGRALGNTTNIGLLAASAVPAASVAARGAAGARMAAQAARGGALASRVGKAGMAVPAAGGRWANAASNFRTGFVDRFRTFDNATGKIVRTPLGGKWGNRAVWSTLPVGVGYSMFGNQNITPDYYYGQEFQPNYEY